MSEADAAGAAVVTVAATDVDDAATNGNGAVTYLSTIGECEVSPTCRLSVSARFYLPVDYR